MSVYGLLQELNPVSMVVRILLAACCGGILGIERAKSNQAAGMRTYMLVCLGSTVVMLTSQYMAQYFNTGDPARLGAQVISGIGFLGAGSIMTGGKLEVRCGHRVLRRRYFGHRGGLSHCLLPQTGGLPFLPGPQPLRAVH